MEAKDIMFDITTYVCVCFFNIGDFVFCTVGYHHMDGWQHIKLMDRDHQSLIETLDAIWPQWHDAHQAEARSE